MRKIIIFLTSVISIASLLWLVASPGYEPAITFMGSIIGLLTTLNYHKEGVVSFSDPSIKIEGNHFQSGRIIAGDITAEVKVSNETNSQICIKSASISISSEVELFMGEVSNTVLLQNYSAQRPPQNVAINIEKNSFIILRVKKTFTSKSVSKLDQARAIGKLKANEACNLSIDYQTIKGEKQYQVALSFNTDNIKSGTRQRYKENGDHEAIVCILDPNSET